MLSIHVLTPGHRSCASRCTSEIGLLQTVPPSVKTCPYLPIAIGAKKVDAADVARQASHILHSSKTVLARKEFRYERRYPASPCVTATTNLMVGYGQRFYHLALVRSCLDLHFARVILILQQHIRSYLPLLCLLWHRSLLLRYDLNYRIPQVRWR